LKLISQGYSSIGYRLFPVDAALAGSAGWNRSCTRCPAGMVVKNLHGNFREKAAKKA
jgi:hypothetical protein